MKTVLAPSPPSTYQRRKKSGVMPHQQHALLKKRMASLDDFTMSDCYDKLVELVPTIPRNRKVSRVEILQHVIDYIQDLQIALDNVNINVRDLNPFNVTSCKQLSTNSNVRRTPFSTLQSPMDCESQLSVMACTQESLALLKEIGCSSSPSKLHPYDTPESSPDSHPCTC